MTEAWSPHLIQTITAGEWTVHAVADARFRADGGIAFSMVPRSLWEREVTVIDGTIPLRVGVLLAERPGVRLVVDTGLGERGVDRAIRGFFGDLTATGGLSRALAELDWAPDSVTHLVLTHLHIDHAGGAFHDGGEPRFPRARTIVSRRELSYALDPHPLRGPVFDTRAARLLSKLDNLAPVDTLITEVGPELQVIGLGGHTPGLIGVRLGSAEETLIVPGDLLPTRAHRRPRWVLSYDQDPSSVFDGRRRLVSRAMALGWIVHFGHDPLVAFGRFRPGGDVEVVPAEGRGLAVA
jgi:glyoxylase-like metal-dependent hydrolase (beta-lactamase superfamily II)